nr:hypothetical protein BaRGS_015056 [Batillaria attramentaria]
MEGFHKMQDDLERVIEKEDTSSTVGIIVLVVFDILLVLSELLFDLEIVRLEGSHQETVPEVLHYCSIFILSLFLIEIGLRIFVMRLSFFTHKLELFDAVVVIVSFVLDVVFRNRQDAASGVGLLVILRLWRVARILNAHGALSRFEKLGIVLSVKRQAEKKIEREKHMHEACEQELTKFRSYCTSLESEIESLHRLLKQHGIQYSEKVEKRPLLYTGLKIRINVAGDMDNVQ